MDLAKIRQKARKEQNGTSPAELIPNRAEAEVAVVSHDEVAAPQAAVINDDLLPDAANPSVPTPLSQAPPPHRRKATTDPIEIILAGREAAGCNEDMQLLTADQTEAVVDDYEEFLCIRVSNEIYGINIMQIKEIIKPREVTEVPRAPSFLSGVISLRGVIIPVLDMLDRLGLARTNVTSKARVVVVRHGDDFSGLLVDEVIQVVRITTDKIESAPPILDGINRDFVTGIGRADNRMIILLNLETITDINLY